MEQQSLLPHFPFNFRRAALHLRSELSLVLLHSSFKALVFLLLAVALSECDSLICSLFWTGMGLQLFLLIEPSALIVMLSSDSFIAKTQQKIVAQRPQLSSVLKTQDLAAGIHGYLVKWPIRVLFVLANQACVLGLAVLFLADQLTCVGSFGLILSIIVIMELIIYLKYYVTAAIIIVAIPFGLVYAIYTCIASKVAITRLQRACRPVSFSTLTVQVRECAICLLQFSGDSKVLVGACNPSHVYHEVCGRCWVNVKNSCPVCRDPLVVV